MIEKIEPWIQGKRVLLLGFGREGRSTYNVLRRLGTCAVLDVADQSAPEDQPEGIETWISGPDYQSCLNDYDVVFKSPGVVLERPVEEYRCQILSQTEVFFQCFRDQIIGITGTKGKSTITTLLYHLLKHAGYDTILVGNIGIPVFDLMEDIRPETIIVCELSCHQLEYMTVSPHIAVLSNIHEEHLDHYGTMEKYVRAKEHIFLNQTPEDVLICSVQCLPEPGECVSRLITACPAFAEPPLDRYWKEKKTPVRQDAPSLCVEENENATIIRYEGTVYRIPQGRIRLLGQHNYFDIGFAYAVCRILHMSEEDFTKGLIDYEPLPHRLQFLGELNGVKYYDDSISTICETAIQALKTLKDTDTILIGGMDRGIDYRELIEYLSRSQVPHIILMEATGKRIFEEIMEDYPEFENTQRLITAEHLEDAVQIAKEVTRPGHSCVMSPAAASYGIFRNFEERGERFRALVFAEQPENTVF